MKTTDPNVCPDALRIKSIGFEEAAELAYFGARIIHARMIGPLRQQLRVEAQHRCRNQPERRGKNQSDSMRNHDGPLCCYPKTVPL